LRVKLIAETTRLEFRQFSAEDAPGLFQLNNDPEVNRYTGDVSFNDEGEALEFLLGYGHCALHGYGRWSVYLKGTGEYVGFCGLKYSLEKGEVDLGFRILRRYWNQGLATEAAAEALRMGFELYGLERIVGRAMKDNRASHRVLEKLGMVRAGEFEESGQIWYQYEIVP
jgi:RimJ/RimL family protein N-acetyltransferase